MLTKWYEELKLCVLVYDLSLHPQYPWSDQSNTPPRLSQWLWTSSWQVGLEKPLLQLPHGTLETGKCIKPFHVWTLAAKGTENMVFPLLPFCMSANNWQINCKWIWRRWFFLVFQYFQLEGEWSRGWVSQVIIYHTSFISRVFPVAIWQNQS